MLLHIARVCTLIPAGYVIAITLLAIVIEVAVIVLRFLNIGFINANIRTFLIIVRALTHLSGL